MRIGERPARVGAEGPIIGFSGRVRSKSLRYRSGRRMSSAAEPRCKAMSPYGGFSAALVLLMLGSVASATEWRVQSLITDYPRGRGGQIFLSSDGEVGFVGSVGESDHLCTGVPIPSADLEAMGEWIDAIPREIPFDFTLIQHTSRLSTEHVVRVESPDGVRVFTTGLKSDEVAKAPKWMIVFAFYMEELRARLQSCYDNRDEPVKK